MRQPFSDAGVMRNREFFYVAQCTAVQKSRFSCLHTFWTAPKGAYNYNLLVLGCRTAVQKAKGERTV
jgi:hypothetical protein